VRGLSWIAVMSVSILASGCGTGGTSTTRHGATHQKRAGQVPRRAAAIHRKPSGPRLLPSARSSSATAFVPAVSVDGRTAAWVARSTSGIVLLSFDQRLVTLELHSGTIDAGAAGWRFGPSVGRAQRSGLVAAFNGGFKLSTGAGGFMSYGRTAAPLRDGLGSIVTYASGITDVGSWGTQVPASGQKVSSVRQNLVLLVNHGSAVGNVACLSCWGPTLGGVEDPARSALGVTADGRLIWAGGEHVTVAQLATTLLAARVVRAVELDINPEWVASYLYDHRGPTSALTAVPQVPGQPGELGQFLVPYSRDFFSLTVR